MNKETNTVIEVKQQERPAVSAVEECIALAGEPTTRPEVFSALADHHHNKVREAVAVSPHTPLPVLVEMMNFPLQDSKVNAEILKNPQLTPEVIAQLINAAVDEESYDVLTVLAEHPALTMDSLRTLFFFTEVFPCEEIEADPLPAKLKRHRLFPTFCAEELVAAGLSEPEPLEWLPDSYVVRLWETFQK